MRTSTGTFEGTASSAAATFAVVGKARAASFGGSLEQDGVVSHEVQVQSAIEHVLRTLQCRNRFAADKKRRIKPAKFQGLDSMSIQPERV
jgi:hypothetical protein